jgi:hypothetical protein
MQCACASMPSVACLSLQDFSIISHKRHDFRKMSLNINFVLQVYLQFFFWNIFHSKKNLARYGRKSIFVHTRQNSTHPQSTEALNAGTSTTPDFTYSNRSSEPARHTIVFFSFVHDINIVTWRWPSTAETCSRYRRNKHNTKTVVFLTDPTSFF